MNHTLLLSVLMSFYKMPRHISELQALLSSFHKSKNPLLALELLSKALDQNPDIKTLKNFHTKIFHLNSHQNPSLGIKLMRSYAACGEPKLTRKVFDEMSERNVVFYNVMIRSYVNNYLYNDGLFVFRDMVNGGFRPDNYTYPCVLKACSCSENLSFGLQIHGDLLKVRMDLNLFVGNGLIAMYGKCGCLVEARRVFDEMLCRDVVSWNSMVAVYAHNMRFDDALEICREMEDFGQKPDGGTMASLMPAVANTSSENVLCVEKIFMNLERKNLISWNVMIRVYMKNSMPTKAVNLYLQMEKSGVEPDAITCASVLPACDTFHPQSKEIYKELAVLMGKMKELGYVPETDSALHDVEEEDKEGHLAVHSEKLAIVFALLNTQESQIRITKNLRVCGDCHIAAKLISKIVEREIVIRDTNRFHHFKDGVCSCGDYW
ncbi:hypothetical protein TSUD_189100 [Trifolium subterraneum]|uniref:DYW domain-containing protein n=1 Tax=Trifolium subterraneum TaxID=3900 RepID=A0A2Z6PG06_TRISU|nr:hypothetical protein TSUD_189100 [Trifolium subterraneum]